YTVGIARYSDFDENDYEDHQAHLSAGMKTPRGFYLTVQNRFQDTEDPFGSESEFRIGTQTERWNNRARLVAGAEFAETYGIEGTYHNFVERYDLIKDEFQDQTHHEYGVAVLYRVTGKTSLFGQFLRTDVEYDSQNDGIDEDNDGFNEWNSSNSQDYTVNGFFIGARFDPRSKLSGEFKIGYGTIDFENDVDVNGNKFNDNDFWLMVANVGFQFREKTGLSLTVDTSKQPSTTADIASDVSATFRQISAKLDLTQNFTERMSANFGLGYRYRDYLDEASGIPDKYFNLYTAKFRAGYLIQDWLEVGLEYTYDNNQASDSLYELDEYTVNTVAVMVKATF
ncbi:MAG: outer membrane beta-barrel protein, partial [Desulfobacterales bacterium]